MIEPSRESELADARTAALALCAAVRGALAGRVVSFVLHGSAVLGDLAAGYSDLDFLAVVEGDLSEAEQARLKELRGRFRAGEPNGWGRVLEGAFLPRGMLDPAVSGGAYWWGTSGERPWVRNELGWFTLWVIRERGEVLWGEDIRGEIPPAPEAGLAAQVTAFCGSAREHARGGGLKSVDWLLTAARLLKWVKDGVMSSKTQGADWALEHAAGAWRQQLPLAKAIRLSVGRAASADVQRWLEGLRPWVLEACEELEGTLAARGELSNGVE